MTPPTRPPDDNTNSTIRILLGVFCYLAVANSVATFLGRQAYEPVWITTLLGGALLAIVYATYKVQQRTAEKPRLLLVEDDPYSAGFVRHMLLDAGYEVLWAASAEKALQMLRGEGGYAMERLPDKIVLDLKLPAMSGEEFLKVIKSDPALSWVPVIIWSVQYDDSTTQLVAKAAAWVQKGEGPKALLEALEHEDVAGTPKALPRNITGWLQRIKAGKK